MYILRCFGSSITIMICKSSLHMGRKIEDEEAMLNSNKGGAASKKGKKKNYSKVKQEKETVSETANEAVASVTVAATINTDEKPDTLQPITEQAIMTKDITTPSSAASSNVIPSSAVSSNGPLEEDNNEVDTAGMPYIGLDASLFDVPGFTPLGGGSIITNVYFKFVV